jgi:hypothetical protein
LRLVWGQGIESLSGVPSSQDQVLEFTVRPAFTATFSCLRVNADSGCLPFAPMQLSFTAPVARSAAEKMVLRGGDGKVYRPKLPEAAQAGDFVQGVEFVPPFPEEAGFKLEVPRDLRDDAGRKLINQERFPLAVRTDVAPPLAKFPARFGIIEAKGDPMLPVTLRNLEAEVQGREWQAVDDGRPVPGNVLRIGTADARTLVDWMRPCAATRTSSTSRPKKRAPRRGAATPQPSRCSARATARAPSACPSRWGGEPSKWWAFR